MEGQQRERWMRLCAEAATDQDPRKLMGLVDEINRLLEAKEDRLNKRAPAQKLA